jgi:methyl-accepting chemotaxis protein
MFLLDFRHRRAEALQREADLLGQIQAIHKVQAVVEFAMDGTIAEANDNFLRLLGYQRSEVIGLHHRMFVDADTAKSDEYQQFWAKLQNGEFDAGRYKRVRKDGREVWIEASYNPILDHAGQPFKIVKFATDITAQMKKSADFEGQIAAISKSQAVIEFDLDGKILTANENFQKAMGYDESELIGRHHRMFVSSDTASSAEYENFWGQLRVGQFQAGEYRRRAKDGSEVWIEATYNPIFGLDGKPYKVVKYATVVTERVKEAQALRKVVSEATEIAASEDLSKRLGEQDECGAVNELVSVVNGLLHTLHHNHQREQSVAASNLRIRAALDNVTTNVMIADNDRRIIYMNSAIRRMLRDAERDIQKELSGFDLAELEGTCIDAFHKNPDHQARMISRLQEAHHTEIRLGGRTFALIASPVINGDDERLGTVVEWRDRTAELKLEAEIEARAEREREIADENLRIRNALDNVSTNVMIADNERRITYINRSLFDMFTRAEADLRKDFPQFDVRKVLGSCIDIFHKNPVHQQRMIDNLIETHRAQIMVGGRAFNLTVSPILNDAGERRGTVVEWLDRKAEMAIENEVKEIVQNAVMGDFSMRLSTENKTGFLHALASGLNQLLGTNEKAFGELLSLLSHLAKGDLRARVNIDGAGIFSQLRDEANSTLDQLTNLVARIRQSADAIDTSSREIAVGNSDLSQRTEEQAASLEETASSMEELTTTVQQNADNARQANQLAAGASEVAVKGGDVVRKVVVNMESISEASRKIADIISVIDSIAFQTNILALNAAVEAARAGEQGRGFAVVATEVRSLAQRSADAAKEINRLITDSVDRVKTGKDLVDNAGETMGEIVSSVQKVTDIMAEITAASQEQSNGISQVNQAITQMDDVTQQNAALVEESAASAKSMEQQAESLVDMVQVFKLDQNRIDIPSTSRQTGRQEPRQRSQNRKAEGPSRVNTPKHSSHHAEDDSEVARNAAPPTSSTARGASSEDHTWTEF